jgi:DNA helicase-2/ATP-dependent DNA helicase PcrA
VDVTPITGPLNDAQRAAVTAELVPMLVLAGAGSGKTRVLVHRVAWLVQVERVSAHGVLAVTFTNKAAAEMRGRIETLLGFPASALWVGTFHGLAHRLLRMHWREAGLDQHFQILDSDDQQRLIKRVLRDLELDEARWPPRELGWFINANKDEGKRPGDLKPEGDAHRAGFIRVYAAYEQACARGGVVDFAELLLRCCELLRGNAELLAHYRRRFRHLLVDEFQDTNAIQYSWLRLLAGDSGIPFVVGDDDQSIYRWRGARIEHIHRFQRDFPGAQLVRLEQNYRSTGNILAAANALIAHNAERLGKNLWTSGGAGDPIRVFAAFNDRDEVDFVVNRVRSWSEQGGARREIAVLYRSNAQSRLFEEALIAAAIPYRVYGGLRFFERAEIKDALAYLRLMARRDEDGSFERVVNVPTRGIGARTLELLREQARGHGSSLWQAAQTLLQQGTSPRVASALQGFMQLIDRLATDTEGLALHERVDLMLEATGLVGHWRAEGGERGEARVENLEELVSAARGFEGGETEEGDDLSAEAASSRDLNAFLAHAALESGEDQADAWEDCIQLMTLHSAKGLEFPLVFIVGMEEGLFPHRRSSEDAESLEEERRLCYVGMTRAMRELYLCYAEQRRLHGMDMRARPSQFIGELPSELLEEVRPRVRVTRPYLAQRRTVVEQTQSDIELRLGQRVRHSKYGEGVVLRYEGHGPHVRVQVNFERAGTKELLLALANLEVL